MTDTIDLSSHSLLAISKESLAALRSSLARDLGGNAANYLHEAGYGGAGAIYEAFSRWLQSKGGPAPAELALDDFAAALGEFFAASGWGTMGFSVGENGVATVESSNWAEAAGGGLQLACYFTSGVLTDFFGRITDAPVAVMETECRSLGHERCKFLIGWPEKLQQVYDQLYGESVSR
jgi:predicted hydrocarbon binding protein